ncbi:MAG: ParA family protein [Porticoccaceae bacterium]
MKIIACYNIKGGVGKTASAVNLAYLSALDGRATLMWDLDPQAAASFYFRVKPRVKGGGRQLLRRKGALDDAIKATDYAHLDLIPADFSYRNMDLILEDFSKSNKRLAKLLKPLRDDYDYLFLDCPPGISLVSENVLAAADVLLVPTIPTTLSLRTLAQLQQFCADRKLTGLTVLPFFSMVDLRKSLHRLIIERPPSTLQNLLTHTIPYASEIERMGLHRAPVDTFAHSSRAADAYRALWKEVKAKL